jgi:hypothetical protein
MPVVTNCALRKVEFECVLFDPESNYFSGNIFQVFDLVGWMQKYAALTEKVK